MRSTSVVAQWYDLTFNIDFQNRFILTRGFYDTLSLDEKKVINREGLALLTLETYRRGITWLAYIQPELISINPLVKKLKIYFIFYLVILFNLKLTS